MIPGGVNELLLRSAAAGGATAGRSVRFNSADSASLSKTFSSTGNRKTYTLSLWCKRSKIGGAELLLTRAGNPENTFRFNSDALELFQYSGGFTWQLVTTQLFRDPSAWYHILIAFDTTQATSSNRVKLYVNGTQVTAFSTASYPSLNFDGEINTNTAHEIGVGQFNGYLALVHFIDGQALTPSSFGETSATTGQWIAKTYAGSYGTNGFFLDFLDNSTAAALGYDAAGSNDWTVNNLIVGPTTTTNDSWSGYFDGNGDYLTLSSNASMSFGTGTFTIEGWFLTTDKSLSVGAGRTLIGNSGNSYTSQLYITTNGYITFGNTGSTFLQGSTNLADASWHHVAVSRSGTGSNQIAMWVDGTRVAQGTNAENYTSGTIYIGAFDTANGYWNGYISNLRIVKGSSVYDPSNSTITVPTSPLTAITNTALLICKSSTFVDNSTNAYTVTANGNARVSRDGPFEIFSDSDSLRDHPVSAGTSTGLGGEVSGNYATLNPIAAGFGSNNQAATFSNGNLDWTTASTFYYASAVSTIAPKTGKYYVEAVCQNVSNSGIGFVNAASISSITGSYGLGAPSDGWHREATVVTNNNSNAVTGMSALAVGDIIGLALDLDNGKAWWSKNGTWHNSGNPANGTNATVTFTAGNKDWLIGCSIVSPTSAQSVNFGQRAWAYTCPSGFSPLVDTLLPTPTIAKPNTVMDVVLYTGTGSSRSITGLEFSPDLVWLKARSTTAWHEVFDSVRGALKHIFTNDTAAESTLANTLTSFDSNGFSLGSDQGVNWNTVPFVAWTWDAGSSNATNTSGTITSTVRANISAGFSVVTWTGNGSNGQTIGHGLGVTPSMVLIKNRSVAEDWVMWFTGLTVNQYFYFNVTDGIRTFTNSWGSLPTSSVFSNFTVQNDTDNYVAYCWTPVAGYSAFGSYTGNGSSTDGPYIHLGFRAAVIIVKMSSSTGNWTILDDKREGYNVDNDPLYPNLGSVEGTADLIDITSNGFKVRTTDATFNTNAGTYIYAAWASAPFPYSRAR